MKVDESKIKTIKEWPIPSSIHQARSFHALSTFYRRFVKNFSSIIAPLTEVNKSKKFKCNEKAQTIFEDIKRKLTSTPILALLSFSNVFNLSEILREWA